MNGTAAVTTLISLAMEHLAINLDPSQQADRENRLEPMLKTLSSNVFRLVVMGEIKKGKSSFINALLGEPELLPTNVDIATSTVFKIVYGTTERFTVFYFPEHDGTGTNENSEVIHRADLWIFGTERGAEQVVQKIQLGREMINEKHKTLTEVCSALNIDEATWNRWIARFGDITADQAKQLITHRIDFIAIELPHSLLKDGTSIIDTPGVGGLFKRHRDITFRYAPQADVVFFVLDSAEAPASEDELKFLKELQKNTQHIVFLQTKIDIADEVQVEIWRKRNLGILAKALNVPEESIPYFLVGAKMKQLADKLNNLEMLNTSGYPAVLKYVKEGLIPKRDEILARKWFQILGPELANSASQLADRAAIIRNAHLPEIAEYEKQLQESSAEFEMWQKDVWPKSLGEFNNDVGRLRRSTKADLVSSINAVSKECAQSREDLREDCRNAVDDGTVEDLCDQHLMNWSEIWYRAGNRVLTNFRSNFVESAESLLGKMEEDMSRVKVPEIQFDAAARRTVREDEFNTTQSMIMSQNAFGGVVGEASRWGGALTAWAVVKGVVAMSFGLLAGAAMTAGWVATRVYAAARAFKGSKERHRLAIFAEHDRVFDLTCKAAKDSIGIAFEDLDAELKLIVNAKIDETQSKRKNDFSSRKKELQENSKRSANAAKAAEENLNSMLAKYRELITRYKALKQQLEAGATQS